MADTLRMDHINSLPQPFLVRLCGDDIWWPVNDFEVETALLRIDVCGLLQVKSMGEVMEIKDGDHVLHNPETFYADWPDAYTDPAPAEAAAWSVLAPVGRGEIAVLFSTRPSLSDSWVKDLWDRHGVILTESPPCEMSSEGWPERWNAADASPLEELKSLQRPFDEPIEDARLTYRLQAAHYADAFDKLTVIVPAPTGKRYGPYDADPHTKGRRRRFRTQRKA